MCVSVYECVCRLTCADLSPEHAMDLIDSNPRTAGGKSGTSVCMCLRVFVSVRDCLCGSGGQVLRAGGAFAAADVVGADTDPYASNAMHSDTTRP